MTGVRVEKRFRHSRGRVFEAFVDPLTAGRWLFRTPGGVVERAEYDARPGGEFAVFERRGEMLARHFGRFVEVERPGRIVFDFWIDEAPEAATRVTVLFEPDGEGCRVVLSHDLAPAWAAYAERSAAGWTMMLDNLERVLTPD